MKDIDTPGAVADYTGVPVSTLAQWRYLERGPRFVKVGRMVRYRRIDIDEWLTANTVNTKEQPADAAA